MGKKLEYGKERDGEAGMGERDIKGGRESNGESKRGRGREIVKKRYRKGDRES